MLDDDVTKFSLTTTPTQLQPLMHSNMVEEGLKGQSPSSSEISFPAALSA